MRSRRLACFLLGLWLAGGVFMQWVSRENTASVERLLNHPNPAASLYFRSLGPIGTRQILTYQAEEQNRFYFEAWEIAQILLGFVFFFFLLLGTREDKISLAMALALLLATLAQRFLLTPEISAFGRVLDFVSPDVYVPGRPRLGILQSVYTAVELGKMAMMLAMTARIAAGNRKRSGGDIRKELDLINKANYRHVDR